MKVRRLLDLTELWDSARYRDNEAAALAHSRTSFATAIVHEGRVVAMTDIGVNRVQPEVAYQWHTIVDRPHRGHSLELLGFRPVQYWSDWQLDR